MSNLSRLPLFIDHKLKPLPVDLVTYLKLQRYLFKFWKGNNLMERGRESSMRVMHKKPANQLLAEQRGNWPRSQTVHSLRIRLFVDQVHVAGTRVSCYHYSLSQGTFTFCFLCCSLSLSQVWLFPEIRKLECVLFFNRSELEAKMGVTFERNFPFVFSRARFWAVDRPQLAQANDPGKKN